MKAKSIIVVAVLMATTALGGCDRIKSLVGGKPAGQVVATVDGEEITALELRQELGGFSSRDQNVMKQAQQAALQQIIMRRLIAQEAKKQKLDKTPEYNLQVARGEETLLGRMYQQKIASKVAVPTAQEASAYIAGNPNMFQARRVLVVEQVVAAPNKIEPARFQPLKSLEEVKALLASENVAFQQNLSTLDTLSVNPQMLAQIDKMPPGEVFVVPQGRTLLFNRIRDTQALPFQGEPATMYAMNALRAQKAQDAVRKQVESVRKAAEAKITYNEAFKPPPKKAAAPAAAAQAAPK